MVIPELTVLLFNYAGDFTWQFCPSQAFLYLASIVNKSHNYYL
ncbi:MAG: hypothetical protein ACI9OH_002842 [Oleispira sp.]|jgi:hypothetical protein